ncbi:MAG: hypothetical protein GX993_05895 [Bacteroidales bacterium]|nr:hypothetical protein [Bacteroidales bacterium]
MKRRYLLTILILFLSVVALSAQDNGGPQYKSLLSRDSILIGDQIEWRIPVRISEGEDYYIERPDEPVAPGVETIKGFHIDTISFKRGQLEVEGRMTLTVFDSGSFFLPPVIVHIERADGSVDTLFYDGPIIDVNTIQIDTATFVPFDIKGQIKYPVTFSEILLWIGIALVVALIIWFIVRAVKRGREGRSFFGRPIVKDPPHIVALRSLEKIRGQKLWQNNRHKQFYTAVTDTLRVYISDRYHIAAMEQTSNEMFEELKDKEIDPSLMERLRELFTTADFVKFAKYTPSIGDNENAIPTAVRFVNSTFLQEIEKEKEE